MQLPCYAKAQTTKASKIHPSPKYKTKSNQTQPQPRKVNTMNTLTVSTLFMAQFVSLNKCETRRLLAQPKSLTDDSDKPNDHWHKVLSETGFALPTVKNNHAPKASKEHLPEIINTQKKQMEPQASTQEHVNDGPRSLFGRSFDEYRRKFYPEMARMQQEREEKMRKEEEKRRKAEEKMGKENKEKRRKVELQDVARQMVIKMYKTRRESGDDCSNADDILKRLDKLPMDDASSKEFKELFTNLSLRIVCEQKRILEMTLTAFGLIGSVQNAEKVGQLLDELDAMTRLPTLNMLTELLEFKSQINTDLMNANVHYLQTIFEAGLAKGQKVEIQGLGKELGNDEFDGIYKVQEIGIDDIILHNGDYELAIGDTGRGTCYVSSGDKCEYFTDSILFTEECDDSTDSSDDRYSK